MTSSDEPVLTLEPFIEAVRDGVEGAGWVLSGLQKTTSHEYAGRWRGESSRSAYLFFHRPGGDDGATVEGFLDETSRGVEGNLSLVLEGPALDGLGDPRAALAGVAAAARKRLPAPGRTRVALKLSLDGPDQPVDEAESEIRVKRSVGAAALGAGVSAVAEVAAAAVRSFERLLEDPDLRRYGGGA